MPRFEILEVMFSNIVTFVVMLSPALIVAGHWWVSRETRLYEQGWSVLMLLTSYFAGLVFGSYFLTGPIGFARELMVYTVIIWFVVPLFAALCLAWPKPIYRRHVVIAVVAGGLFVGGIAHDYRAHRVDRPYNRMGDLILTNQEAIDYLLDHNQPIHGRTIRVWLAHPRRLGDVIERSDVPTTSFEIHAADVENDVFTSLGKSKVLREVIVNAPMSGEGIGSLRACELKSLQLDVSNFSQQGARELGELSVESLQISAYKVPDALWEPMSLDYVRPLRELRVISASSTTAEAARKFQELHPPVTVVIVPH